MFNLSSYDILLNRIVYLSLICLDYLNIYMYIYTHLAYSMTITCIPKHTPKKGTEFSRANFAANIFPSTPLLPNPPGTRIPIYIHIYYMYE